MRERFTNEEWETLLFAPILANYAVAMADGAADSGESRALAEAAAGALAHEDELTREVCQTLVRDYRATVARVQEASKTRSAGDVIVEAARLADSMNRSGSPTPYKQFLLEMCLATAEAAGPAGGPRMSTEEHQLVQVIRTILDIPE